MNAPRTRTQRAIELFCTATLHIFNCNSCRICEKRRKAKYKAIMEKGFDDITFGEALHRYSQLCHSLTEITNVAYTAPDTTVTFANITEGEQIDMFIPIVSTPPLSDVQCGISYDPRLYDYRGDCIWGDGEVFIQNPLGNDDLKKFISSLYDTENASTWERTWVLDVTQYDPLIHDVFFEVHIDKYERTPQGATRVTFTFKLPQHIY